MPVGNVAAAAALSWTVRVCLAPPARVPETGLSSKGGLTLPPQANEPTPSFVRERLMLDGTKGPPTGPCTTGRNTGATVRSSSESKLSTTPVTVVLAGAEAPTPRPRLAKPAQSSFLFAPPLLA